MQLTKHRDTFTLTMSSEELLFLVNNLGSDPQTTEDQEKLQNALGNSYLCYLKNSTNSKITHKTSIPRTI